VNPQHFVTGIILSGGKSTRMGENKAFIELEGVPIVRRIYTLFKELFKKLLSLPISRNYLKTLTLKFTLISSPIKGH